MTSGSDAMATHERAQLDRVIELVTALSSAQPPLTDFFAGASELFVARAPGRLDVMGGIADYSGSLVLEMPIAEAAFAVVGRCDEPSVRVASVDPSGTGAPRCASAPSATLLARDADYSSLRGYFRALGDSAWASYVAGCVAVLARELDLSFAGGARILIASDVPEGKGVSSSAAIEVATMRALAAALGVELEPKRLALLCQQVENQIVGAPCGVMDQLTSACGSAGRLLELLCQPAELGAALELPAELEVCGIDSGVRHAVTGADYGQVRVGAFMGYRIIAELAGLPVRSAGPGRVTIEDHRFGGYLANVTPAELESEFAPQLPERLSGAEFLQQYGGTSDAVTTVDPDVAYAVRAPTAHPIQEHFRVRAFAELLGSPTSERRNRLLGELMFQSHASYSSCGLGSDATDRLVELVRRAGPERGLYGAKITGGGSGGTVAVLSRRGNDAAVQAIASEYENSTGRAAHVFRGSSSGAASFGAVRLDPARGFTRRT